MEAEFGVGGEDLDGGVGDGEAREVGEAGVGDFEGEEGGGGVFDAVAEAGGEVGADGVAGAAESEEEAAGGEGLVGGEVEVESAVGSEGGGVEGGVGADDDAGVFGGREEAVDDALGGVGLGEDAAVGFDFEGDAAVFEPGHGVGGAPVVEGADELFGASGVELGEGAGVEAGVGDVAAAAAGDFDFAEDVAGFFEDEDAGAGAGFGEGDGAEEAGGAAACDDEVEGGRGGVGWRGAHGWVTMGAGEGWAKDEFWVNTEGAGWRWFGI